MPGIGLSNRKGHPLFIDIETAGETMGKDVFLSNLKKFLKSVVCDRLFAEVSDSSKKMLEKEIEAFIRENS